MIHSPISGTMRSPALAIFLIILALPAFAQTALPMTDPATLSRIVNDRAEIERLIILATPLSLSEARSAAISSKVISDEDRSALLEIIRGVDFLLYPADSSLLCLLPDCGNASVGPQPQAFRAWKESMSAHSPYHEVLAQLEEASKGKPPAAQEGADRSLLCEILPALAIFRSHDRNVISACMDILDRFRRFRAMPTMIRELAEARQSWIADDFGKALEASAATLARTPEAWPAALLAGLAELRADRPADALRRLMPLADARKNDPGIDIPYARALYLNAEFGAALPVLERRAGADSPSDILLMASRVYISAGRYADSSPLLEAASRRDAKDRDYLSLRIRQSAGLGQDEQALRWARKALQNYPRDPEIMVQLAGCIFRSSGAGDQEAAALCEEALKLYKAEKDDPQADAHLASHPLASLTARQNRDLAVHMLISSVCERKDWYLAASLLEGNSTANIDRKLVSTILLKSGRTSEALSFARAWYDGEPSSQDAASAYLRALAASAGGGLAWASEPGRSDIPTGLATLLAADAVPASSEADGQKRDPLLDMLLKMLASPKSSELRSYLYYLRGNFQKSENAAIECYRKSLLERADNVEALLALARIYSGRGDSAKAQFYLKQAKSIGADNPETAEDMRSLEASISG